MKEFEVLFWEKVDRSGKRPDECWIWTGALNSNGYGNVRIDGTYYGAHRVAYMVSHGIYALPRGQWVLHRCDNPPCVNPAHLFVGTHQDNVDDCRSKGRNAHGERHGCARLRRCDVRAIRELHSLRWSGRDIAKAFDVSYPLVSLVVNNKVWA